MSEAESPHIGAIGSRPFLTPTSGAVETFAYESGRWLANRYQVHLIGPARQMLSLVRTRCLDVDLPDGLQVHPIENLWFHDLLAQSRLLYRKQRLHGWRYLAPFLERSIALLERRPVSIIHVHNTPDFVPRLRESFPKHRIILHLHNEYLAPTFIPFDLAERAVRESDLILVCSDFLARAVVREFPGCRNKVQTVYYGVDATQFAPAPRRTEDGDSVKILFAGRLTPQKGVHILAEAVTRLLERGYPINLSVAGSAVPEKQSFAKTPYVRALMRMKESFPTRIDFLGYVSPQDMPQIYRQHDIFLAPSQWNEPFGLVFLEAMASGLPVVSTQRGGIPEFVENGSTGFLIEDPWDVNALADRLCSLIDDRALSREMGIAGRKLVEARFTWEHVSDQLDRIYQRLLGSFTA